MGCEASEMTTVIEPSAENQNNPIIRAHLPGGKTLSKQEKADLLFKTQQYAEAIKFYQETIQEDLDRDYEIAGLGFDDEQTGYYQWNVYEWYTERRKEGTVKGNPYDGLALCYSVHKKYDDGILWYEAMLRQRPNNYQLLYGYATILENKGRYDESIKVFNKLVELKPEFAKSYLGLAYIYELHRIEKTKSVLWANKMLEKAPNNEYAMFILARNQKDVQTKIAKLKVVHQMYPKNTRIINEIGIVYGGTVKDYKEAIVWYKKVVEVNPKYSSIYNNIGVNYELMKDYQQAKKWYYTACEYNSEYKAPHKNLTDIYDTLKMTDDAIIEESRKYNLKQMFFFYEVGLSYYDKKKVEESIKWYKRAVELDSSKHQFYNSLAIAYDEIKQYDMAIEYYLKTIEMDPTYFSAYYNLAITYKNKSELNGAENWYKKCIGVNPRHSYSFNNLGNIYKDQQKFQDAVDCYLKAVEFNSTYTLAFANMAVCYLKLENYKEAFNSFARAEEVMPNDNNNLSDGNKNFLKTNLKKFKDEGDKWKVTGSINPEIKQVLVNLIREFENKFKSLYANVGVDSQHKDEKIFKQEILETIQIIYEDQFKINHIGNIFDLVQKLFITDEDYFHIIPQIFIQYFWNNTFVQKRKIQDIENELQAVLKIESEKFSSQITSQTAILPEDAIPEIKLINFQPLEECVVNLFKKTAYFNSYEQLFSEITVVNADSKKQLPDFKKLVEDINAKSNGHLVGVGMKFPDKSHEQFKVVLRVLEKMFKKEINAERVKKIIKAIDDRLMKLKNLTLVTVVHEIMEIWTKEITDILKDRLAKKIETACPISDLVRGKCMYEKTSDIVRAVAAADELCKQRGFEIIELGNRLKKVETKDVVLKIRIKDAVCELQLAMKQDESRYHFIHSIYEIERSPLGCIFGSYLFMSKGFKYPLIANCRDIERKLKASTRPQDQKPMKAAAYIVETLRQKAIN